MTQVIENKITLNETEIEKFRSLNANSVDSVLKLGQAYAELKKQHSFEDFKTVANLNQLPHSKKTIERLVLISNKAIFHNNKDKLPFRYSLLNLLASCVEKLRVARVRMREEEGKCEGRKSLIETNPKLLEEVKRLRRKPRGKKAMSLRKVSAELFRLGYKTSLGKPYSATQIKRINV